MKSFNLYENHVKIINDNGSVLILYFNENSGKVYYRYKIDTISNVKHPGIFLGVDINGVGYFLHNHYHYGRAVVVTENEFTQEKPLYIYTEKCSNAPLKVIEVGLREAVRGEQYHFLDYNCQTFTNTACNNVRKSETVNSWLFGGGILALVGIGLAVIFENKK